MNCDEARKLLSDRLDRPLTTEQAAQLRAHLATCQPCREFNRALNDSVAGIGQLPRSLPSNRVRDNVNGYVALHPEYGDGRHRGWVRQAAGLSAAAIVLVAVSALLIVMLRGQTGGPSSGAQIASQPTKQNSVMSSPASKAKGTPRTFSFVPSPATPTPSAVEQTPTPRVAQSTAVPSATAQPSESATSSAPEPSPSTTLTPTPAQPAVTDAQASQVVNDYFDAINRKDYATAWSLFSEQMKDSQGAQSLQAFANGYAETDHDDVHVIANVPDSTFTRQNVMVQVAAHQTDGTIKWYSGTYTVGIDGGKPLLVSANVQEYPTSEASTSVDTSLPACTSDQLGDPRAAISSSSTNYRSYTVNVANNGATCQLSTTLTVTITDANKNLLWVFGNNQPLPLVITVPSGGTGQEFDWKNWCATPTTGTVSVKVGGEVVGSFDNQATPECTDPESPTTIGMGDTTPLSGTTNWSGTVVSVDAGSSTIKLQMPDKSVRALSVDPMATITDASGGAIDVSAIQPGESMTAKGQIAANGNTLVATSLSVGPMPSSGTSSPTPTPAVKP